MLAVNEALANVVDHAYPPGFLTGRAALYAWEVLDQEHGQRRIVAVITSSGQWKPAAIDSRCRGRGLTMATCMDSLQRSTFELRSLEDCMILRPQNASTR